MRKLRVLSFLVCTVVFATAANAASNPKATGDAGWINPWSGQPANITFNAIATTASGIGGAKGSLIYDDPTVQYTMDVQFINVQGNTSWFVGQITQTTAPQGSGCCDVGHWVLYQVQDNGEPGSGKDLVWGEDLTQGLGVNDPLTAASYVITPQSGVPNTPPIVINVGNIQVH